MTWYVFTVPPQKELVAKDFLVEKHGIEAFSPYVQWLPVNRRGVAATEWKKRTILHGYILINCEDPWSLVRRFGILKNVISFDGVLSPVPQCDMDHMKSISGQIARSKFEPLRLTVGQTIRITEGSFNGLQGAVEALNGMVATVNLAKPVLGKNTVKVRVKSLEAA
jgi:transcription antitermination factor NusG